AGPRSAVRQISTKHQCAWRPRAHATAGLRGADTDTGLPAVPSPESLTEKWRWQYKLANPTRLMWDCRVMRRSVVFPGNANLRIGCLSEKFGWANPEIGVPGKGSLGKAS